MSGTDLRLEGAGMDETYVAGMGTESVVSLEGPGNSSVDGISFHYESKSWANVVEVIDGHVD
ncbi:MAG: hypothetical protein MUQ10_02515 [Anaerolineae bacterium]|nr:hypothetical protein [Anaerolineae bacterium]